MIADLSTFCKEYKPKQEKRGHVARDGIILEYILL